MSIIKNRVLLLKSERSDTGPDKYKDLLEAHNFEVMIVKTLTFQYKNIDILREKLLNPTKYSGIILSSPRCVNAVSQALPKDRISELWGPKDNFTVGETTHEEAVTRLGIECKGKETGNAKNLSFVIIQNKSQFDKPFLFPHGNLKTDTLKLELGREGLSLEEVPVYDTLPNPEIGAELQACTEGFSAIPEYVVFFSPSGFHSTREHLNLSSVKIIAIGPVTQLAIEESNLKVHAVAAAPTPTDILNSLL